MEKFLIEWEASHKDRYYVIFRPNVVKRKERVAIIGTDEPALIAARDLSLLGYCVIIFDGLTQSEIDFIATKSDAEKELTAKKFMVNGRFAAVFYTYSIPSARIINSSCRSLFVGAWALSDDCDKKNAGMKVAIDIDNWIKNNGDWR